MDREMKFMWAILLFFLRPVFAILCINFLFGTHITIDGWTGLKNIVVTGVLIFLT